MSSLHVFNNSGDLRHLEIQVISGIQVISSIQRSRKSQMLRDSGHLQYSERKVITGIQRFK